MKKKKLLKKIAKLEVELANAKKQALENLYKFPPHPNCRCTFVKMQPTDINKD